MFSLSGEEVFLKAGAILDYETNPVLDVQVNVDDPTTAASPDDSAALSITVEDITAPTVEGITRLDANPTLAPSLRFAVQFSEPVKDVGADDFSVMTTGTLAAAVSGVTDSGSSYEVTVDCASGEGTLHLDIPASAQISVPATVAGWLRKSAPKPTPNEAIKPAASRTPTTLCATPSSKSTPVSRSRPRAS